MTRAGRTLSCIACASLALAALTTSAWAQGAAATPLIYPAKGQSAQQQDRDKYECHDWARAQSGFDPTKPATVAQPLPPASAPAANSGKTSTGSTSSGSTATSMATGAMGAAAVAQLTHHDPARAAAAGALGGGVVQRVRQQQQQAKSQQRSDAEQQQQQQAMQQQAARMQQQRATYDRATAACMEGRGYTVK